MERKEYIELRENDTLALEQLYQYVTEAVEDDRHIVRYDADHREQFEHLLAVADQSGLLRSSPAASQEIDAAMSYPLVLNDRKEHDKQCHFHRAELAHMKECEKALQYSLSDKILRVIPALLHTPSLRFVDIRVYDRIRERLKQQGSYYNTEIIHELYQKLQDNNPTAFASALEASKARINNRYQQLQEALEGHTTIRASMRDGLASVPFLIEGDEGTYYVLNKENFVKIFGKSPHDISCSQDSILGNNHKLAYMERLAELEKTIIV